MICVDIWPNGWFPILFGRDPNVTPLDGARDSNGQAGAGLASHAHVGTQLDEIRDKRCHICVLTLEMALVTS